MKVASLQLPELVTKLGTTANRCNRMNKRNWSLWSLTSSSTYFLYPIKTYETGHMVPGGKEPVSAHRGKLVKLGTFWSLTSFGVNFLCATTTYKTSHLIRGEKEAVFAARVRGDLHTKVTVSSKLHLKLVTTASVSMIRNKRNWSNWTLTSLGRYSLYAITSCETGHRNAGGKEANKYGGTYVRPN